MSTTTITGNVSTPAGEPRFGILVRAYAVYGSLGIDDDEGNVIVERTSTDKLGNWTLHLTPNSELTPIGSWYRIRIGDRVVTKIVPAGGGTYNVDDPALSFTPSAGVELVANLADYLPRADIGVASGAAGLDGTGRIPIGQMPTIVVNDGTAFANILDYAPVAPDTDWGAACQRAIDALPWTGGVVYIPPSGTTYTFTTKPTLRLGITIQGGGADSTRITTTAGGFGWDTYLYRFHISDIRITTTAGGHMFAPTNPDGWLMHSTFRRCQFIQNDDAGSIIHMDGAGVYINNEVEVCEMTRRITSTVPGVFLRNSAGALNSNSFRRLWVHSNNCPTTPFFRIESTGTLVWQAAYDTHFEDIISEQGVGGVIHAYSVHNLVIDNVREWDATTAYTGDNFKIGKSSVPSALLSSYCRLTNVGCGDAALSGGVYHINIVPGEATACLVQAPNRSIAGQTMNLAADTIVESEGKVTAPSGFVTGTATKWSAGTATPEAAVTGAVGDLRSRTDGSASTVLYVKESGSGNTGWARVATVLEATATLDFASIAAQTGGALTVTVTGAAVGDAVALGPPAALEAGLAATGFVSASNTVTVRLLNVTVGAIDPASASWKVRVHK